MWMLKPKLTPCKVPWDLQCAKPETINLKHIRQERPSSTLSNERNNSGQYYSSYIGVLIVASKSKYSGKCVNKKGEIQPIRQKKKKKQVQICMCSS